MSALETALTHRVAVPTAELSMLLEALAEACSRYQQEAGLTPTEVLKGRELFLDGAGVDVEIAVAALCTLVIDESLHGQLLAAMAQLITNYPALTIQAEFGKILSAHGVVVPLQT